MPNLVEFSHLKQKLKVVNILNSLCGYKQALNGICMASHNYFNATLNIQQNLCTACLTYTNTVKQKTLANTYQAKLHLAKKTLAN